MVRRASLSAASTASEPEFMKNTVSSGSGNVAASSFARRIEGSEKPIAIVGAMSLSTCSWIAAVTAGW